jgi:hypothetical protein
MAYEDTTLWKVRMTTDDTVKLRSLRLGGIGVVAYPSQITTP